MKWRERPRPATPPGPPPLVLVTARYEYIASAQMTSGSCEAILLQFEPRRFGAFEPSRVCGHLLKPMLTNKQMLTWRRRSRVRFSASKMPTCGPARLLPSERKALRSVSALYHTFDYISLHSITHIIIIYIYTCIYIYIYTYIYIYMYVRVYVYIYIYIYIYICVYIYIYIYIYIERERERER